MITVITPLRKKFASLDPSLQKILLKDLGFLTLPSEYDQLKFVEAILELTNPQRAFFVKKMLAKQKSKAYKLDVQKFEREFSTKIVPALTKKTGKAMASKEKADRSSAEENLKKSLKDL